MISLLFVGDTAGRFEVRLSDQSFETSHSEVRSLLHRAELAPSEGRSFGVDAASRNCTFLSGASFLALGCASNELWRFDLSPFLSTTTATTSTASTGAEAVESQSPPRRSSTTGSLTMRPTWCGL